MEKFLFKNIYIYFVERGLLSDLFKNVLLTPITIGCLASVIALGLLFYRNPFPFKTWFYKLKHWFLTMAINGIAWFLMAYMTCIQVAKENRPRNPNDPDSTFFFDQGFSSFLTFGLQMAFGSCIIFFLLSIGLRYTSTLARKTPF